MQVLLGKDAGWRWCYNFFLLCVLLLEIIEETRSYHLQWKEQSRWSYKSNRSNNSNNNPEVRLLSIESRQRSVESVQLSSYSDTAKEETKYRSKFLPTTICENSTFCENTSEYPTELINNEIKKNPSLLKYSSVDMVSYVAQKADAAEPEALCIATERVVYPKSGETKNNQWLFIINQNNFTQGVRIETCIQEDSTCKVIDGFAEGYTTACKQKYIYRELSAVAADGTITREFFRFPASCCCHVQFTGEDYVARFRGPPDTRILQPPS